MQTLKNLSFDNIKKGNHDLFIIGKNIKFSVVQDSEILAEAMCSIMSIEEFANNYYLNFFVKDELNQFKNILNLDEELSDNYIENCIKLISLEYCEEEISSLKWLYKNYNALKEFAKLNPDKQCIYVDWIKAHKEGLGAGTLIVDYLKDSFDMIVLYGDIDAEAYWLDVVNFREILNGHMYWSKLDIINKIF
jgi:ribonuclease HI